MKSKRKPKSRLHLLSIVWGILFSVFIFLTIGVKIVIGIFEDGPGSMKVVPETFVTWDDPSPYFFTYIVGYVLVFWKPLWGSIIIMAASIYYVMIAGVEGPPIFAAPGFLVGALYFAYWFVDRRNQTNAA